MYTFLYTTSKTPTCRGDAQATVGRRASAHVARMPASAKRTRRRQPRSLQPQSLDLRRRVEEPQFLALAFRLPQFLEQFEQQVVSLPPALVNLLIGAGLPERIPAASNRPTIDLLRREVRADAPAAVGGVATPLD